jgi:hypothetical protein
MTSEFPEGLWPNWGSEGVGHYPLRFGVGW